MTYDKQRNDGRFFPLVKRSQTVQSLVGLANQYAKCGWIIPVEADTGNRLEIRSLFMQVVMEHNRSDSIRIIGTDSLSIDELEHDDATSLLFLQGEDIPKGIQCTVLETRTNFPVVMLVTRPRAPHTDPDVNWAKAFRDACAPLVLAWPAWQQREADHADIIRKLRARISLPQGQPVPEFDDQVMYYLTRTPFRGTAAVKRAIDDAIRRYLRSGDSGPLTVRHIGAFGKINTIGSHTDVPPLSVVR